MGLGGMYAQLPLSIASMISGIGSQQDSSQMNWAQLLSNAINGTQNTQQTWQPTTGTDIFSILAKIPWGDVFGGKK
jgi:hypothetical protein